MGQLMRSHDTACTCPRLIDGSHHASCPTTATIVWWWSASGSGALVCATLRDAHDTAHRIADEDPTATVRYRLPDAEI